MKLLKMTLSVSAAVLLFGQADTTLQKAIREETVEGDLKGAIELYRKTIGQAGKDRVTAAQALIHMGDCYERMGDAEARKAYERVVREYADQKEAVAQARTKLGGNAPAARKSGLVTRQVWTGFTLNLLGKVSFDERAIAYTDWATDDLIIGDLASGQKRNLTKGSGETGLFPAFSRDGKQVAYASWTNVRGELRLMDVSLKGAKPRSLFTAAKEVQVIGPIDWSPDGKWLAVQVSNKDHSGKVAVVSTADGAMRVLRSFDTGFGNVFISPDGKYVAYDLAVREHGGTHDIYTIATDGTGETAVVANPADDKLLGWTPDGGHLLFASDRSGHGIWAQPVAEGKRTGEPKIIKADINPIGMGLTRSGSLYYATYVSGEEIYLASVDFATGRVVAPPEALAHKDLVYNSQPIWSPDGKYLAYHSMLPPGRGGDYLLAIRSSETGKVRELRPGLGNLKDLSWSPNGKFVVAKGRSRDGRNGVFRIDAESGEAVPLTMRENVVGLAGWSVDGKILYLVRNAPGQNPILAFDMQTGQLRDAAAPDLWISRGNTLPALSPDGKQVLGVRLVQSDRSTSVRLIPADRFERGRGRDLLGPNEQELLHLPEPESVQGCMWSPDARFVICTKTYANDPARRELWSIPVHGGMPHKLGLESMQPFALSIHPDGHRVAFTKNDSKVEVWVMENFLPALQSRQ